MTQNEKAFFKRLGKRISELRKGLGITQAQLAAKLNVSQQLVAAYEASTRKVPASMLPTLARLFAVSLDELIGLVKLPVKRGPVSVLQQQIEQIASMPRPRQKFIVEMLDAMIKQQQASGA